MDLLKEMVRGFGLDPEKVLVKEALSEAHRGIFAGDPVENQAQALWGVLKQRLISELKGEKS